MFNFLFKRSPKPVPVATKAKGRQADDAQTGFMFGLKADSAPDIEALEIQFMALLFNGHCGLKEQLLSGEQLALEALVELNEQDEFGSQMVPRLPHVIPRLMAELRNADSTADDLVNLITEDLTIVAEVIRLSNSAYYRTGEKIESLKQAVIKLGINGVRQLVVSALIKPILNSHNGRLTSNLCQLLWQKNQKAALAGNYIAVDTGVDRFHAYLAGLLNQSGLILASKTIDNGDYPISSPFSDRFLAEVDLIARQLSVKLSRQWEMPAEVTSVLADQTGSDEGLERSSLANTCYVADKLAKVSLLEYQGVLQAVDEGFNCRAGKIRDKLCRNTYHFINLAEIREQQH